MTLDQAFDLIRTDPCEDNARIFTLVLLSALFSHDITREDFKEYVEEVCECV